MEKDFSGAEELRRIKAEGPERKLVPFVMEDKAVPRQGMAVEGGGEVTSGTHSPMLDEASGWRTCRPSAPSRTTSSSSTCAAARAAAAS
jgi:hypothetical protein